MAFTLTTISRKESFSRGDQSVTRVIDCVPYSARFLAYDALIGGVVLIAGRLVRTPPARDPEAPWLFVDKVEMEPWDEDPGAMAAAASPVTVAEQYQAARLTVTYKRLDDADSNQSPQNEQQEIDLATESWQDRSRNLQLPNVWMIWAETTAGANDVLLANTGQQAFKYMPEAELVMTRHLVPRLPFLALLQQQGRINKSKFRMAGFQFPPETLRFEKWRASRKYTNRGVKFYELGLTFGVRPIYDQILADGTKDWVGWNRVYDPRKGYYRIVRTNTSPTKYLHEYDEDGPTQQCNGATKKGFALIFNPYAS